MLRVSGTNQPERAVSSPSGSVQGSGQKANESGDGREATTNCYQPGLQNTKLSHNSNPPTQRVPPRPHILQERTGQSPRRIWASATKTVSNTDRTETEGSALDRIFIREKKKYY